MAGSFMAAATILHLVADAADSSRCPACRDVPAVSGTIPAWRAVSEAGTRRNPIFPGPDGSIEIKGPNLVPASLYEAQFCERMRR
jgi:hypothetical protein